jgi:FkbM family methyltransferase
MVLKQLVKEIFNQIGFDIIRLPKSPAYSLLGLRNLHIRTIIDIGANKGQFAKWISNIFPQAEIYCFEPLPEPFNLLKRWAEKQKNRRIKSFNFALGDNEGIVNIFMHIDHSSSSSFLKTTETCEQLYPFTKKQITTKVKLRALDKWIASIENPSLDILIKLDVQGYEASVIKGGIKTFGMAKACILEVNLDQLYEDQATFESISKLLNDLGYCYAGNLNQTYADDGRVIFIDAVFVREKNLK